MLAVFAAFETDVRRERQAEGITKAKRAGRYQGGVKRIDRARVQTLKSNEAGPSASIKLVDKLWITGPLRNLIQPPWFTGPVMAGVRAMWKSVLTEARELAWLASIVGGLSVVSVGLAIALSVG